MSQTNTARKTVVTPRLIANDNGYAYHKLAWKDERNKICTGKIPTRIQVGGDHGTTTGQSIGAYEVDGQVFQCLSSLQNPLELRNADYPVSVANRVLFVHALAKNGLLGLPVSGAVTLPFSDYFNPDGSINEVLRAKTEANFTEAKVTVCNSEVQPHILNIRACAEGMSAWFDWAMTDDGDMSPAYEEWVDAGGEMLVVDIGGSTTDLVTVGLEEEQLLINHAKSGTEKVGVIDVLNKLQELVRARLAKEGEGGASGHAGRLSEQLINNILQKGECMYAGKKWDFRMEVDRACSGVAERITNYIKSRVGNPGLYHMILVVGGGSIVFRRQIEALYSNAVFGDEFSNARGALKFLSGQ